MVFTADPRRQGSPGRSGCWRLGGVHLRGQRRGNDPRGGTEQDQRRDRRPHPHFEQVHKQPHMFSALTFSIIKVTGRGGETGNRKLSSLFNAPNSLLTSSLRSWQQMFSHYDFAVFYEVNSSFLHKKALSSLHVSWYMFLFLIRIL